MTPALQKAFAPTGVLRASINTGNPILAKAVGQTATGVSVDLATLLAERLDVPLALQVFKKAAHSVQAVEQSQADIGFFAVDPERGQQIAFTWPYVLIEGTYMVAQDSPITTNEAVDVPGHRVIVGQGTAYDLFLTRHLKQATIVRTTLSNEVVQHFLDGQGDVAAGVKQQLLADSQGYPQLKLLDGRFMVIKQAMGVSKTRGEEACDFLRAFVEEAKQTGFVQDALKKHGIEGGEVAPADDATKDPLAA